MLDSGTCLICWTKRSRHRRWSGFFAERQGKITVIGEEFGVKAFKNREGCAIIGSAPRKREVEERSGTYCVGYFYYGLYRDLCDRHSGVFRFVQNNRSYERQGALWFLVPIAT